MTKLAKTSVLIAWALAAAGFFAGFVVGSGDPLAQKPKSEKSTQAPGSWIGEQVITKSRPRRIASRT